jgi:hypothetical protein
MNVEGCVAEWTDRVRAEYLEMPGLSLTTWQMCRLWLIDAHTCDAVVSALVASGFLHRRANQSYARVDDHV